MLVRGYFCSGKTGLKHVASFFLFFVGYTVYLELRSQELFLLWSGRGYCSSETKLEAESWEPDHLELVKDLFLQLKHVASSFFGIHKLLGISEDDFFVFCSESGKKE